MLLRNAEILEILPCGGPDDGMSEKRLQIHMLGKKKAATPGGGSKQQRTITSFFSSPAVHKGGESASGPNVAGSCISAVEALQTYVEIGAVQPAQAKTPTQTQTIPGNHVEVDTDGTDRASRSVPLSRKRSKYVIDDDSDSENGGHFPSQPANKNKRVKDEPFSKNMAVDEEGDGEGDTSSVMPSDRLKTPSRKSIQQFASPHLGLVSTPARNTAKMQASAATPGSAASSKVTPFASEKKKERNDDFKKRNEDRYAFLLDERDADLKRPGEEGHDPHTLYIPPDCWKKFSAFEKQFWEIKAKHWDTIVFFKKGKFWELYEKDAEVAHREFDWKLTDRVNMKLAGVPEMSFDQYASQFVARGYKVARVDQVENAIAKEMQRKKQTGPSKKEIIHRELTMILTAGTLVDTQLLTSEMSTYCMSIKEDVMSDSAEPAFGVTFVDTSTAQFGISYFNDDVDRTHLETLLMQLKPKELVLEKGRVSQRTQKLLKNCLNDPQINHLLPDVEFWSSETTVDELRRTHYFGSVNKDADIEALYPDAIKTSLESPLATSSLGGLFSYLRSLKLDKDLVSAKNFQIYDPMRQSGNLILDGQTLLNLEVFENTSDGTSNGTLFKLLNHCVSPSGKRLFKSWVCHPLQHASAINDRLDAVDDMIGLPDLQALLVTIMKKLPDLERIISRIHAGSCRVKDFVLVLHAFSEIFNMMTDIENSKYSFKSTRLVNILCMSVPAKLKEELLFFNDAFDHSAGVNTTEIYANPGFDDVYDEMAAKLEGIEAELDKHRKDMEVLVGTKLTFRDSGKDLFQLEAPARVKKIPSSWIQLSKTQAVTRYYTPEIKRMLESFLEAREERDQALKQVRGRMFARFDENYQSWLAIVKNLAEVDCLLSLSFCRASMGGDLCRPEFITAEPGQNSVFEVEELRHPCIVSDSGKDFIPNDTKLGGGCANMILLTGPNMGGKSTLLRQTCIAVIMAQLGCYVPAKSCKLTPFERIFTRIGAHDNILAGQSTFMVELSETSKILREATPRSLVILDELGRGTSTFDGFAIAFSVLYHLLTNTCCLGLFSTHYGMLTKEFENNALVSLKHMSFVSDEEKHQVTFLYKLVAGACPKSFGMNVALMAGVDANIVDTAERVASDFEKKLKMTRDQAAGKRGVKMSNQADFVKLWKFQAIKQVERSLKVN